VYLLKRHLLPPLAVAIVTMLIAWVLLTFDPGKWTVILVVGVAAFVVSFVGFRWFHPDNRYYRFAWSSFGVAATSGSIPTIRAFVKAGAEGETAGESFWARLLGSLQIDGVHAGVCIAFIAFAGVALLLDYKERKRRSRLISKPNDELTNKDLKDILELASQEIEKRQAELAKERRALRDRNKWSNE